MVLHKKRGQAALEFLTTYGWAFLVILIMIGALAYFGVLNPKSILPARCTFSPEIDCLEHEIKSLGSGNGGEVSFRFRNNVGASADFIVNMTYIGADNPDASSCVEANGDPLIDVPPGRTREIKCTFDQQRNGNPLTFPNQDKAKFEITVDIKKTDGVYSNPIKGEIYGTVN